MSLKNYFLLSVAVFAAVIALAIYFEVPIAPFALILLFAETLIGFELEDHKIPRLLASIFRTPKTRAH